MYSSGDKLSARYDYPVEYYHYPSLFPRATSHFQRALSEERDVPRLTRYRASSLPPVERCVSPIRDLTPYYDAAPTPPSAYRTSTYYRDLPTSYYDSRALTRIRYQLEPLITSPISNSLVPFPRYRSSTPTYPVPRYYSTPSKTYYSYPSRYTYTPSRYFSNYEPNLHKSTYTQHRYGSDHPTKFTTYKMVYPSIYSYYKSYLN